MPSDIELLQIEIDTLWERDARGRLVKDRGRRGTPAPHFLIGAAADGEIVEIGSEVPDDVAEQLRAIVEDAGAFPTVHELIARCSELLEAAVGRVEVLSGLGYFVPQPTTFPSEFEIIRSSDARAAQLRDSVPERANWSAEDWHVLIDGRLGPWAMAIDGGDIVSICHSSRFTEGGAEAGVWTDPGFRGRGMAATVTAAWSSAFGDGGRYLFYSTEATNFSSQRVTARLQLRQIGTLRGLVAATG